ncbi:MAG TPA: NAD(P)/FAD-dependent oxidoreductase [Vicinamibacterales bacterium]|jgi:protoporphyrinogen oxidase|nr:NAD(P)/FAD-dependent oxidoreductase [Vicinamibacterales bacterium]
MHPPNPSDPVVVAGAGPAGLAAAHTLLRLGRRSTVIERQSAVGGLSRTEQYRGYRFDIGGHRFLTQVPEVEALWHEVMGRDLLRVRRLSRIHYDGRFFDYPLSPSNLARNIGPIEGLRIAGSYARARVTRTGREETFEDWVTSRFGARLYRTFFKTYTEKVWGVPCTEIRADWAAQRIRNLSLWTAVRGMVTGARDVKSLAGEFLYPRLGPGQMWERFASIIRDGGSDVQLGAEITRVHVPNGRVAAVTVRRDGVERELPAPALITSIPLSRLVAIIDAPVPTAVSHAAASLAYRDFIVVNLIVRQAELFPDNWIYVHTPDVSVGRIQNYKNWSADLVPDQSRTCLGMEYFCTVGDALWQRSDAELLEQARREIGVLGLARSEDVEDGCVIRERRAYPVYDADYQAHVATIRGWLNGIGGLYTVGRNGMHRYNNQDHAMLTGMLAAENVCGAAHDLWQVNTERSYYEEQRVRSAG